MKTGFPISSSTKQKLNTISSTESDIVRVDDFMPSIIWTRNFLNAQDYDVTGKHSILWQKELDSSGEEWQVVKWKQKKHINIQYSFVTDRIKKGEVTVDWCTTYDMTGDLYTKTNQGLLFRQFRDMIMGVVRQPDPGKVNNSGRYSCSLVQKREQRSVFGELTIRSVGRTLKKEITRIENVCHANENLDILTL